MHSDVYELIWFKLRMVIDTAEKSTFSCSSRWTAEKPTFCYWSKWLWPWLRVTRVWESKTFCTNYLPKSLIHLYKCCVLLRHVGVMNLILILSCLINIQGKETYLCDVISSSSHPPTPQKKTHSFVFRKLQTFCCCCCCFYKHGSMIKTIKLNILIQFEWPWPSVNSGIKNSVLIFPPILQWIWIKCSFLWQLFVWWIWFSIVLHN